MHYLSLLIEYSYCLYSLRVWSSIWFIYSVFASSISSNSFSKFSSITSGFSGKDFINSMWIFTSLVSSYFYFLVQLFLKCSTSSYINSISADESSLSFPRLSTQITNLHFYLGNSGSSSSNCCSFLLRISS